MSIHFHEINGRYPILSLLSANRFITSDQIIQKLGLKQVEVEEQIRQLKKNGFHIIRDEVKGFRMAFYPDHLFSSKIQKGLRTHCIGKNLYYYLEVDSTNLMARRMIQEKGAILEEGVVIVARKQYAGRGRLGRQWFSPAGGIWLTVILLPLLPIPDLPIITLMTGIIVTEAIRRLYRINVKIKWPNDILFQKQKVSGILTESGKIFKGRNWVVVGIGINLNTEKMDFPKDLQKKIISLKGILGEELSEIDFIQMLCLQFEKYYEKVKKKEFSYILNRWKELNATIGEKMIIDTGEKLISGKAVNINSKGALILNDHDNNLIEIISGTILEDINPNSY